MIASTSINSSNPVRRMLFLSCCVSATLVHAAPLLAQDSDGEPFELGTIFIEHTGDGDADDQTIVADVISSGSGLPNDILDSSATISVVTAAEIERRGADTTEEVLQYTAGVATDFYGRDDRFDYFNIRGFDAFSYRDGLLIGENFGGIREEPFAFDRVEVLKGANSTAFGVADPGGAVNYITKSATGERQREIYGELGSFNHRELGFDLGDSVDPDGVLAWRLTGKMKDSEAETDHSNDDETFLLAGLTWRPTNATTISLTYDNLFRDGYPNSSGYPANGEEFDRDLFLGEPDFNYLDADRDTLTLKLNHDVNANLSFGTTMRYTDGTGGFGYVFLGDTTSATTVSRFYFANEAEFENFVADAHLKYETFVGAVHSRTLAGVEYRDNSRQNQLWYTAADDIDWTDPEYTGGLDLGSTAPYASSESDTQVSSVYLQQELSWDRLIAQFGLRQDWIEASETNVLTDTTTSGDFDETSTRFGLTYKFTPDLSVYGSYAESAVPAGFGVEPERGEQFEVGVKYRPEEMRALFTASVFDLTKFNETITNPDTMLQEAVGETRARGIELEAKAELNDALSMTASYSYIDSEIIQSDAGTNDGNAMPQIPEQMASLWVNYVLAGEGVRGDVDLGLGARYMGEYFTSAANTTEIDSALIFDSAVGYAISDTAELRLTVTNLFDEQHVAQAGFSANYYNPGREVGLKLTHSW